MSIWSCLLSSRKSAEIVWYREQVLDQLTVTCWRFGDELYNQELSSSLCHCFPETVHQSDHLLMLNSQPLNQLMLPAALMVAHHHHVTVFPPAVQWVLCEASVPIERNEVHGVFVQSWQELVCCPCPVADRSLPQLIGLWRSIFTWPRLSRCVSHFVPFSRCTGRQLLPVWPVIVLLDKLFFMWIFFSMSEVILYCWVKISTSLSDAGRKVPHGFYLGGRLIDWLEVYRYRSSVYLFLCPPPIVNCCM